LSCEHLLMENGYELTYYKFDHLDIEFQGVIHAHKRNVTIKKRQDGSITNEETEKI